MCGIAGVTRSLCPQVDQSLLRKMGDVIAHRGPDAHGEYLMNDVGLAHRRLSIIDLRPEGNQPMVSACGRYSIVFNGEIYNFQTLRTELEGMGAVFRTRTDTEVILAAYARYGEKCLSRLNGMFAFALWDEEERTLFLARDRIGKKPLYYYHDHSDRLAFGSELKCLLQIPELDLKIEPTAVVDYLHYLYIPAPKTIYRHVSKLPPGHSLTLRMGGTPVIREYWDVDFSRQTDVGYEANLDELYHHIEQATRRRMVADVPLGAFLSGGVDSSGIVGLMAGISADPVKTCTIGFTDKNHDESPYAREVAERFSTDHREFVIDTDLSSTVHELPRFFDEPFADSSAVPTYHVSRLARQAVTVVLAGDGGDESFGGYEKYTTEVIEQRVRELAPGFALQAIRAMTAPIEHRLFRKAHSLSSSALLDPATGFARTNSFVTDQQLAALLSPNLTADCSGYDPAEATRHHWRKVEGADHVTRMLYTDLKTYLPGDPLVKVDRMSMAHALEVRAPLLDYEVVEFAATLPSQWKFKQGQKKKILRDAFTRLLPADFLARRKQGFTVPLRQWFCGGLKCDAYEALLNYQPLYEVFSRQGIDRVWQQHQSGQADHGTLLWTLLSFSLWHRHYCS